MCARACMRTCMCEGVVLCVCVYVSGWCCVCVRGMVFCVYVCVSMCERGDSPVYV